MAGPFGTMTLGDQGADVIKVEPPWGDVIRHSGSGSRAMSSYFANLNRSKRSLALDLHRAECRPVLESLLDTADVVVHSVRPEAARRLGIDAASVRRGRPRVIHAAIVGFGTSGPLAEQPVYDHVVQALSGMADLQREGAGDAPHLIRHGLIDKSTGYVLAQSVCAALFQRERTGVGATLEISMLDVAVSFLWPDGMMDRTALHPELRLPTVAQTFRLTPTADGFVSFVANKPSQWDGLIAALDVAGATRDESGVTNPGETLRAARAIISRLSTDEVVRRLQENDVPCAPVLTPDEMVAHPQVVANGTLVEYAHPLIGLIRQARPVPRFAADDLAPSPAPGLGEHSREILADLGFNDAQVDQLFASGAVATERPTTALESP